MPPTPLREVLVCPVSDGRGRHCTVVVLRHGTRCTHVRSLDGQPAALASSELGLKTLEGLLNLPARVLDPASAALLGHQTLLAKRDGRLHYFLGEPFRSLP